MHNPLLYIAAVQVALATLLYVSIRTEGWLPVFRMLRIRRCLVITLLSWGISVLTAALIHPAAASVPGSTVQRPAHVPPDVSGASLAPAGR